MSVARADHAQNTSSSSEGLEGSARRAPAEQEQSISMTSLKVSEPLSQLVEEPLISPKIHKVSLVQIC